MIEITLTYEEANQIIELLEDFINHQRDATGDDMNNNELLLKLYAAIGE